MGRSPSGGLSSGPGVGRRGSGNISDITVVQKSSVVEQKGEQRPKRLPQSLRVANATFCYSTYKYSPELSDLAALVSAFLLS